MTEKKVVGMLLVHISRSWNLAFDHLPTNRRLGQHKHIYYVGCIPFVSHRWAVLFNRFAIQDFDSWLLYWKIPNFTTTLIFSIASICYTRSNFQTYNNLFKYCVFTKYYNSSFLNICWKVLLCRSSYFFLQYFCHLINID